MLVFCRELEEYIVSHNLQVDETSGLQWPLAKNLHEDVQGDWETLCYACLWICLQHKVELPLNFVTRMVLDGNRWGSMYLKVMEDRNAQAPICVQSSVRDQEMLAG